ncbi:MAG: hypothetical protein EAX95_00140 [Candidatus Thorarchaeota archaeon]|nr:hypothetical protein [Candidatus Thorarchaeota archaeon]
MPDIEPVDDILPRILKQYSAEPRGWRVMSTPGGEMLVVGADSAFQLKLIPLSPYKFTGAGIELSNPSKVLDSMRSTPEYGFRPLQESDLRNLASTLSEPEKTRMQLQRILSRSPLSLSDLASENVDHLLTGPVLTRPDLGTLSPEMLRSRDILEQSALKEFRRKYPERAGMFY